jgi:hypothetical protein
VPERHRRCRPTVPVARTSLIEQIPDSNLAKAQDNVSWCSVP